MEIEGSGRIWTLVLSEFSQGMGADSTVNVLFAAPLLSTGHHFEGFPEMVLDSSGPNSICVLILKVTGALSQSGHCKVISKTALIPCPHTI